MLRTLRLIALVATTVLTVTSTLRADFTYNISGTFGTDLSTAATGLAGGSFSGSYTASTANFSSSTYSPFSSYQINLFNAAGTLVFSFVPPANPNDGSGTFTPTRNGPNSGVLLVTSDPGPTKGTDVPSYLQLDFASPFNGVGQANPYSTTFGAPSLLQYNFNQVSVISANSSLGVPTPPSVILAGGMGLMSFGAARLRRLRVFGCRAIG